jgi:cell division protein FtsB
MLDYLELLKQQNEQLKNEIKKLKEQLKNIDN